MSAVLWTLLGSLSPLLPCWKQTLGVLYKLVRRSDQEQSSTQRAVDEYQGNRSCETQPVRDPQRAGSPRNHPDQSETATLLKVQKRQVFFGKH